MSSFHIYSPVLWGKGATMQPKLDQQDERVNQFFYVFAMSAFPSGELLVFETHPINSVLHGNGYGMGHAAFAECQCESLINTPYIW